MYLTVKNHPTNHWVYVVATHGAAVAAVTSHAPSLRGMAGGLVEVLSGYSAFLLATSSP